MNMKKVFSMRKLMLIGGFAMSMSLFGGNSFADDTKKPAEKKPEEKSTDKPAEKKSPANDDRGGSSSADRRRLYMSGEMDEPTMAQAKRGTVMIIVESKFGGGGSGSGWFGIEDNIIITNAHVLGMLVPNAPPPAKITVVINAGEKGQNPGIKEREIPHQRIKIVAVDRKYDIAFLQIEGESDLPPPFKVKPSSECKDNQGITILGFPLGKLMAEGKGYPTISVRKSTIAAKRYDDNGVLRRLQVQGGISPGNSGGPQFDADGDVIAMTVEQIIFDRTIGLSVPTEHIQGLMAGRADDTYLDTAYNKDGKVHIPIRVTAQDPKKRLKSIGVATWIGDSNGQIRPPGEVRRGVQSSDKDFKEIELKYDAAKKEASGELVFTTLTPGMSYYVQPYFQNTITPKYYLPGTKIDTNGPPVDLINANLQINLKTGTVRPFTLERKFAEGTFTEEETSNTIDDIPKIIIRVKGTETIIAKDQNDQRNAARLRIRYSETDLKRETIGEDVSVLPKLFLKRFNDGFKEMEAFAYVDNFGNIYKTRNNVLAVKDAVVKQLGEGISNLAMSTLQDCTISMPNKEVKPNDSWSSGQRQVTYSLIEYARKNVPKGNNRPGDDEQEEKSEFKQVGKRNFFYNSELKYTYQGTRIRGGRKEAVIKIDGKVNAPSGKPKESANGITKGFAYIDISNGSVIESNISNEFELDTSIEGVKQRTYEKNYYKLTRDGSVK